MKQFEFEGNQYKIPESWREVQWGAYIQLAEFSEWLTTNPDNLMDYELEQWYFNIFILVEKDGEFQSREYGKEGMHWSKVPHTFFDMERGEFTKLYLILSKLLNQKPINHNPPVGKLFTIGEVDWGFNLESNKWRTSDIHTVERFQKEYKGHELTENIVSTFFRPIIRIKDQATGEDQINFAKFEPQRFDWIKSQMRKLSCEVPLSVAHFFLTFSLGSEKDTKNSINKELKLMNGQSQSQMDTQQ